MGRHVVGHQGAIPPTLDRRPKPWARLQSAAQRASGVAEEISVRLFNRHDVYLYILYTHVTYIIHSYTTYIYIIILYNHI